MLTTLRLPYPVSANRYWSHTRIGTVILTEAAKAYRVQVRKVAQAAGLEVLAEPVAIAVSLHPRANKDGRASGTCIDLDNALKVTLDALQGCAYENDKQIRRIIAEYGPPQPDGGLSVLVVPIAQYDRMGVDA